MKQEIDQAVTHIKLAAIVVSKLAEKGLPLLVFISLIGCQSKNVEKVSFPEFTPRSCKENHDCMVTRFTCSSFVAIPKVDKARFFEVYGVIKKLVMCQNIVSNEGFEPPISICKNSLCVLSNAK